MTPSGPWENPKFRPPLPPTGGLSKHINLAIRSDQLRNYTVKKIDRDTCSERDGYILKSVVHHWVQHVNHKSRDNEKDPCQTLGGHNQPIQCGQLLCTTTKHGQQAPSLQLHTCGPMVVIIGKQDHLSSCSFIFSSRHFTKSGQN